MKVVINACYGGFGLSDEAILECIALGMKATKYNSQGNYEDDTADFVEHDVVTFGSRYGICNDFGRKQNTVRTHPTIIAVVEKLKEKANSRCSKLKVIEIPFDDMEGWKIEEYDGYESVVEKHREWS